MRCALVQRQSSRGFFKGYLPAESNRKRRTSGVRTRPLPRAMAFAPHARRQRSRLPGRRRARHALWHRSVPLSIKTPTTASQASARSPRARSAAPPHGGAPTHGNCAATRPPAHLMSRMASIAPPSQVHSTRYSPESSRSPRRGGAAGRQGVVGAACRSHPSQVYPISVVVIVHGGRVVYRGPVAGVQTPARSRWSLIEGLSGERGSCEGVVVARADRVPRSAQKGGRPPSGTLADSV